MFRMRGLFVFKHEEHICCACALSGNALHFRKAISTLADLDTRLEVATVPSSSSSHSPHACTHARALRRYINLGRKARHDQKHVLHRHRIEGLYHHDAWHDCRVVKAIQSFDRTWKKTIYGAAVTSTPIGLPGTCP